MYLYGVLYAPVMFCSGSIWRKYRLLLTIYFSNDGAGSSFQVQSFITKWFQPAVNLTMCAGNGHNIEKTTKRSTNVSFLPPLLLLFELNHYLFIWIECFCALVFSLIFKCDNPNFLLGREVWQFVFFVMKTWDSWFVECCVIFSVS